VPVSPSLPLNTTHLTPGLRLAVGVSGGADSVALLRALHQQSRELGLVLHVAHLHHGLRGAEADADLEFVRALATELGLPFHSHHVDTAAEAVARPGPNGGKPAESIEEAARRLRYAWFRQLIAANLVDAIATAHTLDDQAETVLAKFLRGAWTEGLAGIAPRLESPEGAVLRPLLATTRAEIEAYLRALGQPWRTDSSNANTAFTRNRIRHELLPLLESFNARLRTHLAQMAALARDEEAFFAAETARIAASLILPGRPVRGGGRANSGTEGLALDLAALAAQPVALQRRILRHAAAQLGVSPDFPATESLRSLALTGRAGQKAELASGLRAERSHRELRLTIQPPAEPAQDSASQPVSISIPVPGAADVPAYGLRIEIQCANPTPAPEAILRPWKPGDRVTLRHSSGPKKIKEILERLHVSGPERALWPVLDWQGTILWMQGVQLEPHPEITIFTLPIACI
jgi:tRNA(Ile)-lysidine synthase